MDEAASHFVDMAYSNAAQYVVGPDAETAALIAAYEADEEDSDIDCDDSILSPASSDPPEAIFVFARPFTRAPNAAAQNAAVAETAAILADSAAVLAVWDAADGAVNAHLTAANLHEHEMANFNVQNFSPASPEPSKVDKLITDVPDLNMSDLDADETSAQLSIDMDDGNVTDSSASTTVSVSAADIAAWTSDVNGNYLDSNTTLSSARTRVVRRSHPHPYFYLYDSDSEDL